MTTEQAANDLDGLVNLRDLGGMPTEAGGTTRAGVVYRSDAPHPGDRVPEGMQVWPPRAVIDLRDPLEQGEQEHPLATPETEVHRIALLSEAREEQVEAEEQPGLAALYQFILDRAAEKLVEVFRVASRTDGPVLIHCAAGKDRTGVSSALLLRAVDVRVDAIVADYVRTDRNMFRVLQRLNVAPVLPPGVDEEDVQELISAPTDAIEGVLRRLDEHPGGATGWLVEHGAAEAEIERWRQRFLAEPA